jgi:hypothetical protein
MLKVFKRLRGASIKRPSWQRALYTRKRNNDTVFTCFFEVGWGQPSFQIELEKRRFITRTAWFALRRFIY